MSAYATVYRVQCQTFAIWRDMLALPDMPMATPMGHPVGLLRALPPYRTPACLAARKAVSDRMRAHPPSPALPRKSVRGNNENFRP